MAAEQTMESFDFSVSRYIDIQMFYALLVLFGLGVVMMMSTTVEISYKNYDDAFFYAKKHLVFLMLGITSIYIISRMRLAFWEQLGPLMLVASVVLLVMVLIPGLGKTVNGSSRWLAVGPISLQVSEFAKVAMIVYLSGYIVRHGPKVQTKFGAFLTPLAVLSVIVLLLMLEPDFGSAVVFAATVFIMLYLGGVRITPFLLFTLCSVGIMVLLAISSPYRMERIISFMDPWADPYNSGFQLTQALIAIGNGGIFGAGFGESVQKLFYLPEAHNDFVFAVLAEEMGLLGVAILLITYFVFIWRCFDLASQAQKQNMAFAQNIAYGCGVWFTLQTTISLCVNMGLLPTKGLSLPFLSVGGSNLLASCIAVGLLVRVYIEINQQGARKVNKRRTR
ncbi:MAG: putative lipid II flippase FtsW [Pseudomonadota bacterium]